MADDVAALRQLLSKVIWCGSRQAIGVGIERDVEALALAVVVAILVILTYW
jgi:hypothetical protein